ncbi:MAG: carboxypeptidase regulatory-like domain-containing protein [Bryobacteraceae bacterium]
MKHRLIRRNLFGLAMSMLMAHATVWGQVTASISGRVKDATGAGVPNATVAAKGAGTGASRDGITNAAGDYTISSLPVGPYEVRVEKTGFKTAVRTGINLTVGQAAVVNLQLEVGEVVQQVTVSGDAPIVNTTTSSVTGLVGEREVKDLPLNGRSFDNLMALNPGVINYGLKSANTSTSNGNTFSVSGRRPMDNIVLLNGIEYTGSSQLAITPGGVSGNLLGIDAVREFNVQTGTYSAEYGKRPGAQVSVVTQSGTNSLHGALFEFLRNNALDARSFFAQTTSPPPFRQNQFGGSLGGPLVKNSVFLFGNYEGFRQALTQSSVSVVPDAQARRGLLPNASGVYAPVPNLNPRMLQYMAFWPQPNGPLLLSNGAPSGTALSYNTPQQSIREDFGTMRADYFRKRDSLSAMYTIDGGNSLIPLPDPLFASASKLRMQVASVSETHVFSPRVLNDFRAGFSRAGFNLDSALLASFPPELAFVAGSGPGGIVVSGGVTTTGLSGITSAGPNNAAGVWNRRNLFTYTDHLQANLRAHQITAGVWFQRVRDNENSASRQLGQATFTGLTTFLQGTVSTFQVVPSASTLGWRSLFGAWYVQDNIKLHPNLTFSLGLRHEFTTGWNEVASRASNWITDSDGVLITTPRTGSSAFTKNTAKRLFGPRVALAWDVFGNGKTALRTGFGTYYSLIDDLSFLLNSLPPHNSALTSTGSLSSIVPIVPGTPIPPACGPGVPAPCSTFAPQGVQADAKTPAVQSWNLTIEQQLGPATALSAAYAGSFGYHGLLSIDPNTIPARICSSDAGCLAGGIATAAGSQSRVARGAQYIPVGSRPNPYLGAGFFWFSQANSSYNALQLQVSQRLTRGLQFRANYTWAKNLDMNSSLTGAQAQNQAQMVMDRNDLRRDWGKSALNATSQVSISARYELPFGRGRRWAANATGLGEKLIGGWQLNGIVTLLSGFPVTPLIGANRSGDGDTRNPDRPSLNPAFNSAVLTRSPNQWFNPNAFVVPAAGTYGNLGRGVYEGPGLANADVSLFKNAAVSERLTLQFRAEFFNLTNHANFGTPNATVFTNAGTAAAPNFVSNASAGLITTLTTPPRQIQFGLKLIF